MKKQNNFWVSWFFAAVMLLILLNSCGTNRETKCLKRYNQFKADMLRYGCADLIPKQQKETLTQIIYKDTVYPLQIKPEFVQDLKTCKDTSVLKNSYAISRAWVAKNELHHTLEAIPQILKIPLKNAQKETFKTIKEINEIPYPVYVEKEVKMPLTAWERFWIKCGKVFSLIFSIELIAFILYLYYRIRIGSWIQKIKKI